jgi:hypothetical protein
VELDTYERDGEPGFEPYVVLDGLPFPRSEAMVLAHAIIEACRTADRPA